MTETTKIAYLYARVSTGKQAAADLSLPDQLSQMQTWCDAEGIDTVQTFSDAKSGRTGNRVDFEEMIDLALYSEPRPYVIVVHSYSRFFRDAIELELLYRKLAKRGIKLHSLTQPSDDDNPNAKLMRRLIAMFDEYQSEETAKHVRRTMRQNAKNGYWNGSAPPYGYRAAEAETKGVRIKKVLEIDPVEAEIVRLIYALYTEGLPDQDLSPMGVKAVCNFLNENGYRVRSGGPFGVSYVHKILSQATYIGRHIYNRRNSRTGEDRPKQDHVVMKCPAIVSDIIFERARRRAKAANPKTGRPAAVAGPVLLSELAKCGQCGCSMTATTGTSSTGKVYEYYKCNGKVRIGNAKCTGVTVPRAKLNDAVMQAIADQVLEPDRVRTLLAGLLTKQKEQASQVAGRTLRLANEMEQADASLKRLYGAIAKGMISDDDETLKEEIAALVATRDAAKSALDRMGDHKAVASTIREDQIVRFSEQLAEKLRDGKVEFQKGYLRTLLSEIIVHKMSATLIGRTDRLVEAVSISTNDNAENVRRHVLKWCT
ncbi:recombinase family protein, partial [Ahrensia sp. R2A130]|uniref:recombinase family protein n=1 Tax=Ahrensia sp. R2A130 TaxID=744979 RepID=UPI0001E0C344